jgi:hypothetical protein
MTRSKPVKVWVVWRKNDDGSFTGSHFAWSRLDALCFKHDYAGRGARITSALVDPPKGGKR